MTRRAARCTQAEIARALRAAEKAGGRRVVEIAPDGTIRLIPEEATSALPRNSQARPVERKGEALF